MVVIERQQRISGWLVLVLAVCTVRGDEVSSVEAAQRILRATGVKGGLIVHAGCGNGALTVALRAHERYQVQGLERDPEKVRDARARIEKLGLYGPVSISHWNGVHLPYIDEFVNLLVISDPEVQLKEEEILRVLTPLGYAFIHERNGEWRMLVNPRSPRYDDWTHFLHGPGNNAVSSDTAIQPLKRLQWIDAPRYSRHHDHMSSASAMVTCNGRVFDIFDHASALTIHLPPAWKLTARDAFNGMILWQRPIEPWHDTLWPLKSGPIQLPRRLVAMGGKVYVTLGLGKPVSALDAATGESLHTFAHTEGAEEILVVNDKLFCVVNRQDPAWGVHGGEQLYQPGERVLMMFQTDSGDKVWETSWPWIVPGTLAADNARACFFDGRQVVCLNADEGAERWRSAELGNNKPVPTYFAPSLVLYRDVILFAGGEIDPKPYIVDHGTTLTGLDAETGETLWQKPHPPSGYRSPEDVLVINGQVWFGDIMHAAQYKSKKGTVTVSDPRTGRELTTFEPNVKTHWFHHRCYSARATPLFLLTSRNGIEFIDVISKTYTIHHWTRGACLYGFMPANGMIYTPPHPCACYLEAKTFGYNAMAPASTAMNQLIRTGQERKAKGPAFASTPPVPLLPRDRPEWPTFRGNPERSGYARTAVSAYAKPCWSRATGGRVSAPVIAEGRVFLAQPDTHRILVYSADFGEPLWSFTADARIDSPPTVWRDRVFFGSADGRVYALKVEDGSLCWSFLAAPIDMRLSAFGQVESVWPVHGSVLVREFASHDEIWCVAGRSMFFDQGLRLVRLDPVTGRLIGETLMDDTMPGPSVDSLQTRLQGLNMPVALPDILSFDGRHVYMRSQRFDAQGQRLDLENPTAPAHNQKGEYAHLFCPTGFLDDSEWHRSYWIFGRVWKSGAGGYFQSGRFAAAGRPLVFDANTVYGFGRQQRYYRWTTPLEYELFAADRQPKIVKNKVKRKKGFSGTQPVSEHFARKWTLNIPLFVRSMVLTEDGQGGQRLFVAGIPDLVDEAEAVKTQNEPATRQLFQRQADALQGKEGAMLWVVDAAEGRKLGEQKLEAVPEFDGLAAARKRLYLTTRDGCITCFE